MEDKFLIPVAVAVVGAVGAYFLIGESGLLNPSSREVEITASNLSATQGTPVSVQATVSNTGDETLQDCRFLWNPSAADIDVDVGPEQLRTQARTGEFIFTNKFALQPDASRDVTLTSRRIYSGEDKISTAALVVCDDEISPREAISVDPF
jgi:hypothetical protein